MRRVESTQQDLNGHKTEETRVFEVPAVNDQLKQFRETLFADLEATLGSERSQLLRKALGEYWMPPELDYDGSNSGWAVHNFGYRLRIYQPVPGDGSIMGDLVSTSRSHSRTGVSVALDDIP